MATLQVSRPDLETPLSSTLLTFTDISEMEINDKKVVAIICPQVSPGAYYPRCVSGSSSAFTQNGITASGSDAEINATVSSIYSEPTAHFVLTKTGISSYSLRSVGYNFYSPGYNTEEPNGLAWVATPEEFTLSSPIISDTTGIAVNAMASNSSFIRFADNTISGKWLCAGADASEFGFSDSEGVDSVWYVYEINGYVAEDLYTLSVSSNSTTYGTVTGSGAYVSGDTATITATETATGRFLSWSDGNSDISRTISIFSDTALRANFVSKAKGFLPVIREHLVKMWTQIKAYFSASTGASHIGVPTNNINATTVADVVTSIGEPNGIATLGQDGKLTEEQMGGSTLSGSAGSSTQPVYLDDGTITACGNSLAVSITGSAAKVGVATVGSSNQPVYMNAGTPTACGFKVETVTQVPANPDHDTIYIIVS